MHSASSAVLAYSFPLNPQTDIFSSTYQLQMVRVNAARDAANVVYDKPSAYAALGELK